MLTQRAAIADVEWTERGPKNVSGRTRAIMFDPNYATNHKVWAAGITGGLWYNLDVENNGVWQNINDFWDNIAVSSLAYDPNNPEVFYAGTGEGWTSRSVRGAGIWKSTNYGATWARIASTNNDNFNNIQKIIVTSTSRLIVSTSEGLFYSNNQGNTWTQVLTGFFGDIELCSNGVLFASQGERYVGGTVYRSTDNGANWTDLAITTETTQRTELASAPSDPNIIYAVSADGGYVSWFKKSIDGGDNWSDITIPMYLNQNCSVSEDDYTRGQAWYDLILKVHPDNPDMVYAGGIDWHKTTDGGQTWEPVSYWTGACGEYVHADQHAMAFFPDNNSEALVGCDGGVYYITDMIDGFTSSAHVNNSYNVTQFYACAMENEAGSNYMLAGAQDNGTQKFTLPGFAYTSEATGGDGAFCFIDQDNSDIQITSYVYNNWRLSSNGGQSFYYYPADYTGQFINPGAYDSEENVLYASSDANTIFVSDIYTDGNNGNHLSITNGINDGVITAIEVSDFNTNVIYVGTNLGEVYRITDAKTNPTAVNISTGALPNGWISSLDIGDSVNQILVTFSNYGLTSVWESRDAGSNWQNREYNLPDMPIRWGLYNPNNTDQVLLATEMGVWSINDITSEVLWEPVNEGLANVRCDQLRYRTADKMVAVATYGRGLFTSDVFADPEPLAYFYANTNVTCPTDTIQLIDASTKNPSSWQWTISPSTFNFVDGTTSESQNPKVIFSAAGNYTISLTATNAIGSGSITKPDFIEVNDDCRYIMSTDDIWACSGTFYDPGYAEDYLAGQDYTVTIFPTNGDYVTIDFQFFDVEYETNCSYDYLEIYDGNSTNNALIGTYCGTNSPGFVSAEDNSSGALTLKFHSDSYSEGMGWEATIACENHVGIAEQSDDSFSIYPNPASESLTLTLSKAEGIQNTTVEIYNLSGQLVKSFPFGETEKGLQIKTSGFEKGIYFVKIGTQTQKLVIE
jgi:PKD repeat protein